MSAKLDDRAGGAGLGAFRGVEDPGGAHQLARMAIRSLAGDRPRSCRP